VVLGTFQDRSIKERSIRILPGQYFDAETGTNYNYFRDYDPTIGRYVQSDPIGLEGGVNTYSYVGNSPLVGIDPFGLKYQCICRFRNRDVSDYDSFLMRRTFTCHYSCRCFCEGDRKDKSFTHSESHKEGPLGIWPPKSCRLQGDAYPAAAEVATFDTETTSRQWWSDWNAAAKRFHQEMDEFCTCKK
jgi:RHS repeat-associated protein